MAASETHKSRLMELIQKTNMPRPILIQTDNEGSDHAPQFRSHAFVGGNTFTCQRTFNRKKDSVHEVCRLVLEFIAMKFSNEPHPQLLTPTKTHKSLLMEFVQKTKIAAPIFKRDNEGSDHAPQFRCTVFVGGKTFTPGETFPRLRDAEHEASKLALGYLAKHPPTVRLLRTWIQWL